MSYEIQRQKSDSYMDIIRPIIEDCARQTITISIADNIRDIKYATDFVVKSDGDSIGCRTLDIKNFIKFPHFTLRSSLLSGNKTELAKVKEGNPRWYFFGWIDQMGVGLWVFVDMDVFRNTSINNPISKNKWNFDGQSAFNSYSIRDLVKDGCIKNMSEFMKSYLKTYPNDMSYIRCHGNPHFESILV